MSTDIQPVLAFRTPKNTLITVIKAGISKSELSWWMTLLMGTMAGFYLGLSGLLSLVVAGGFVGTGSFGESNPSVPKIAQAATFPIGLILIVLAGAELFTGNTMYLFVPLIERKISFKNFMKNWCWSYLGNFIGCVLVAYFLSYLTELTKNGGVHTWTVQVGKVKCTTGWGAVFLKGIGANWLVCLGLFTSISSDMTTGKIVCLWMCVFSFVAIGFEHSIANMFYVPIALMEHSRDPEQVYTFGDFIAFNLIPSTLGNILGGAFFAGTLEWIVYQEHFGQKVQTLQPKPGKVREEEKKSGPANSNSGTLAVNATPSKPAEKPVEGNANGSTQMVMLDIEPIKMN